MTPSQVVPPSAEQREQIVRCFRDTFMQRPSGDIEWDLIKDRWMGYYPDIVLKLECIGITFTATDKPDDLDQKVSHG